MFQPGDVVRLKTGGHTARVIGMVTEYVVFIEWILGTKTLWVGIHDANNLERVGD